MKKLMSLFLTTVMVLSVGLTGSFAEENGIKVTVDGKSISFEEAKPMYKDGRVMVPFASIFEALGAEVKYENGEIIGTLEEKEIRLIQNSNTAELITNGKSEIIGLDVPVFVESKLNRAYVPVSAVSLAFGYDVYWDNTNKSVNIIDSEKLIDEINSNFTIMNKLMNSDSLNDEINKTYKSNMDAMLDINVPKDITGTDDDLTLAATMAVEAISKGMDMSISGNIKVDPTKTNLTEYFGTPNESLENVPFEVIFNASEGKMYLNSSLMMDAESTDSNVYYSFDLGESMAAANQMIANVSEGKSVTLGELLYDTAWAMKDDLYMTEMDVYSYIKEMVKMYNVILADDLFTVTTSGAKTTYEINMNKTQIIARGLTTYGIIGMSEDMENQLKDINKLDYKLSFVVEKGIVINTDLLMDLAISMGEDTIGVVFDLTADTLNSDMSLTVDAMGAKVNFDMKTAAMETTDSVKTLPADATVIEMY